MNDLLFVYGTLCRSADGKFSPHLAGRADFISRAKARGSLYRISWYPGLTPEGSGWVNGELYRLYEPAVSFRLLDDYEGGEFIRREAEIQRDSREDICAWVYFFQGAAAGLEKIASGIFFPKAHPLWT